MPRKVQLGIQREMMKREWKVRSAFGALSLVENASNLKVLQNSEVITLLFYLCETVPERCRFLCSSKCP